MLIGIIMFLFCILLVILFCWRMETILSKTFQMFQNELFHLSNHFTSSQPSTFKRIDADIHLEKIEFPKFIIAHDNSNFVIFEKKVDIHTKHIYFMNFWSDSKFNEVVTSLTIDIIKQKHSNLLHFKNENEFYKYLEKQNKLIEWIMSRIVER